ncbi:MAG: hypothetical protein UV24_C0001G0016 [Candidatus Nomurabacteria bacterium GW2011_GWA2_42_41]|nr:MAG: hypothetical protein UV24_C0001G0016 [Candidatus Nomurabacteria bacterium GW2011_GWA2_42_41]
MILKKKRTLQATTLVVIFIIVLVYIIYAQKINRGLPHQLNKAGIHITGIENFNAKEISDNRILAVNNNDDVIKIETIQKTTKDFANEYIQKEITLIESFFEPQLPPYPEFLTQESACDEKYKPVTQKSHYGEHLIMYAGERFGYGVCVDNLIKYRATLGYFYCDDTNMLFKMQYFTDKDASVEKLNNFNNSFVCK